MPEHTIVLQCGRGRLVDLSDAALVIVGYSGRDQVAVKEHVEELAAHGVPAPTDVPAVWHVSGDLLTQEASLIARSGASSGEVEPVLVMAEGEVFVTVGSDHTDRELERTSMEVAKSACRKVIAREGWAVPDVRGVWDDLALSSDILVDGAWRPYQAGRLAALLEPEWYIDRFRPADGRPTAIFCGTVPALEGLATDATAFRARLADGHARTAITLEYEIRGG